MLTSPYSIEVFPMNDSYDSYFSEDNALNLKGIALYVDAMKLDKVDELPPVFHEAILEFPETYAKIVRIYKALADEVIEESGFFSNMERESEALLKVPESAEELDEFLSNIIRDVIKEQTRVNEGLERKIAAALKSQSDLLVVKPLSEQLCIKQVCFEWRNNSGRNVQLFIQDEKGVFIDHFRIPAQNKSFEVACSEYETGLYYWTLSTSETSLIGKVYVVSETDASDFIRRFGK